MKFAMMDLPVHLRGAVWIGYSWAAHWEKEHVDSGSVVYQAAKKGVAGLK